jgi:FkbM family methyltransferase
LGRVSKRFIVAGKMVRKVFANSLLDFRLFTHTWRGGAVLKQGRIDGFQVLARADLAVGNQIYRYGCYEPDESNYLRRRIRTNDICIDVGANIGYYTLLMASLANEGVVHAFEPLPLTASILRTNLLLNEIQNAIANQMAVGDTNDEVDFVESADDAFSSLLDTGRNPVLRRTRVCMTTLDAYCQARSLSRIDCLKVDVEGAEEKVIRGAARLLSDRERRPRLIMLELYDPMLTKYKTSIDQMLALMQSFSYQPFTIRRGELAPFSREDYNTHQNVFFSFERETAAVESRSSARN